MKTYKIFFIIAIIAAIASLTANEAFAHRVSIFAKIDGKTVYTESWFSGGKKVQGGTVEVYDEKDNLLLTGKTDTEGKFSFDLPKTPPLKVVLIASMGHKAQWIIEKDETTPEVPEEMETGVKVIYIISGLLCIAVLTVLSLLLRRIKLGKKQ